MTHLSFIKPQKKHIFTKITKIWWFYIVISAMILVAYNYYLSQEILNTIEKAQSYQTRQAQVQQKTKLIDTYYERLEYEGTLANQRIEKNEIRQERLQHILELIPDTITIHFMELTDSSLILKGVTPSKEFFDFGLKAPLSANFGVSSVNFYPLPNGWFEFISMSSVKKAVDE